MIPGLISTIAAAERLMEIETIPVAKNGCENEHLTILLINHL